MIRSVRQPPANVQAVGVRVMNTPKTTQTATAAPEAPTAQVNKTIWSDRPIGDHEIYREGHHDAFVEQQQIIDELEAHADKLAEALHNLTGRAVAGLRQDSTHDGLLNCEAIARARKALAEYEEGKGD